MGYSPVAYSSSLLIQIYYDSFFMTISIRMPNDLLEKLFSLKTYECELTHQFESQENLNSNVLPKSFHWKLFRFSSRLLSERTEVESLNNVNKCHSNMLNNFNFISIKMGEC